MSGIVKLNSIAFSTPEMQSIANKVANKQRVSFDEGVWMFEHGNLSELGTIANAIREEMHGNVTYFNRNFHIEPTNVCVFDCKFCSYSRIYKNKEEGWESTIEEMVDQVRAYNGQPVTEVHIVGGVHPKMDIQFFADLLAAIKKVRPDIHIKAFTAVEFEYMFRKAKLSYKEGLEKLIEAGLQSLPGGGAELFDEEIREKICADKCTGQQWLDIHKTAHELGLHSNATMLYGHIEEAKHKVDHMMRLRDLQDETKGFNTFIPLKFRNKNNQMSDIPETSVIEDLKTYAIGRILMDNFPHVKAYWPMIGRETAQLSQSFGVNDLDGTIDDSTKIYSMAGSEEQTPTLSTLELVKMIKQSGRTPVERGTLYEVIRNYADNPLEEELVSDRRDY